MNYKKLFIKDNLMVTIGHILIYVKGIILLPILIKNIGVNLYGGYTLLTIGMGFISAVSTLGVGFKFKRFIPSAEDIIEKRNLFYPQFIFQFVSAFVVSLLLIISSNFIKATVFKNQVDFSMYLVAFILIFYVLYSVSTDFFLYTHRMNYFNISTVSHAYLIIMFIAVSIYVFHKKTINFLLLAYLSALTLNATPLLVKIFKEIGFKLPTFNIRSIIEDIRLGFPLVLSYVVDFILSASDKYVIALIISTTAVGYYSPAYTLGSLIILIPKVFGVVLPPLLSRATDNGKENEIKTLIDYAIKLFLIIAIPFIFASFVLSKPLLGLLANREVANAAYLVTPIIAGGTLFFGLNLIFSQILFVRLKTKVILGINALSSLLNLVLNIIFIYIFRNILVAAFTTLISYFISFVILNIRIKEFIKVNYNFAVVLRCLFSSVIMALFLYYANFNIVNSFLNTSLIILVASFLYSLLLFFFKTFDSEEIKFIKILLQKIKKSQDKLCI